MDRNFESPRLKGQGWEKPLGKPRISEGGWVVWWGAAQQELWPSVEGCSRSPVTWQERSWEINSLTLFFVLFLTITPMAKSKDKSKDWEPFSAIPSGQQGPEESPKGEKGRSGLANPGYPAQLHSQQTPRQQGACVSQSAQRTGVRLTPSHLTTQALTQWREKKACFLSCGSFMSSALVGS